MARYKVIFAYDGTGFTGSQRQGRGRTVQGEFESALRRLDWTGKSILLAGRTDSGVHAAGQVAAFDLNWKHATSDLQKALNSRLPQDMAVRQVEQAVADFHPRFDATQRCYRYRLFCGEIRDPLRERYAWRITHPLINLEPLGSIWLGTHDFGAFGSPTHAEGSTIRTVYTAGWICCGDEWQFEVKADAFLYRMVRRLVYTQVAVGQGRLEVEDLNQALEHGNRLIAGLAPPNGLTLVDVRYDHVI